MRDIHKILDYGTEKDKIGELKSLVNTNDSKIIEKMILKLDDESIQVRGEAFSSLVLNKNNISEVLIKTLSSEEKNIRAYAALILANREDRIAIPEIMKLINDSSSMVRACALGALGHLKATEADKTIESCLTDSNLEVVKSAIQALNAIGHNIPKNKIKEISKNKDSELERLLYAKNGPEGI